MKITTYSVEVEYRNTLIEKCEIKIHAQDKDQAISIARVVFRENFVEGMEIVTIGEPVPQKTTFSEGEAA